MEMILWFVIVVVLLAPSLFAFAALMWGKDSRYGVDDPEWARRKDWRGYSNN